MPGDDFAKGCKIFLDIQGYVRAARNDKSIFKSSFWKNVFCMKGTIEEIGLMPDDIVESQKNKLLIITNSSKGCDIFFKKNIYKFSPKNIIKIKDAIGAGDAFFVGFISKLIHTNDITKSGNFAVEEIEKFLSSKNNEQN